MSSYSRASALRTGALVSALSIALSTMAAPPASSSDFPPQVTRALTVPAGFGVNLFANLPALPTSLAWGADSRDAAKQALYFSVVDDPTGIARGSEGSIMVVDDLGGVGAAPRFFHRAKDNPVGGGIDQPTGVQVGPDGTVYVSENHSNNTSSLRGLRDKNKDGVADESFVLLKNVPNGRHQLNGMVFGPDGKIYIANGNSTDDGVECGPPLPPSNDVSCPSPEKKPWTGAILRVDPAWRNVDLQKDVRVDGDLVASPDGLDDESVLVSPGYRNIYDVAFWPKDPSVIYTPMNGADEPASNEPLYRTDVDDTQVVGTDASGNPIEGPVVADAGFPSCAYGQHENPFPVPDIEAHSHPQTFEPEDSAEEVVLEKFGRCQRTKVLRPIMFFAEGHNGTTGLDFERGNEFPARYDGDLFVGEWGSLWNLNGPEVTGHKVTLVELDANGLP